GWEPICNRRASRPCSQERRANRTKALQVASSASAIVQCRSNMAAHNKNEGAASMITVHHLNNSRSQRVLWLLEELGVPYEIRKYQRDAKTMLAPPELKRVHPLGKSPVITDGDNTVAESGAIVEYLVERYGNGKLIPPANTPERLRYTYWMHYAEGSAMLPLLLKLIFGHIERSPAPFFIRPVIKGLVGQVNKSFIDPQLELHFDYIDAELGKSEWFAGKEISGA